MLRQSIFLLLLPSLFGWGCRSGQDAPAITIGLIDVDLAAYNEKGKQFSPEISVESLIEEELKASRHIRYSKTGQSKGRLKISAQISADTRGAQLVSHMTSRLDRTDRLPLSWKVVVTEGVKVALKENNLTLYRKVLKKATGLTIKALEEQARITTLPEAELPPVLDKGTPPERAIAARLVGRSGSDESLGLLCKSLDDESEQVTDGILDGFIKLSDQRAIDCLIEWAGNDPRKMARALEATTKIGGGKAFEYLDKVSNDSRHSHGLRRLARQGLNTLRGHQKKSGHHGHDHGEEDHHNVREDGLVKALNHPEKEVRIGAIKTLALQKRTDAVEPLCELLNHHDSETVQNAVEALAVLESPEAIPCLIRWGNTEQRLIFVIEALVAIGGNESRSVLQILAHDHESRLIQRLAQDGLERMPSNHRGVR